MDATLTVEQLVSLDFGVDGAHRLTVPVMVDGRGPFPFIVDTGADRSVLSQELATVLRLPLARRKARVNGIAGAQIRPQARLRRLEVGGRVLANVDAPLLLRENLGALGLVGLDLLAGQRLDIDFDRNRMEIRRSVREAVDPQAIVVRGKARFGRLMLVDSTVRAQPIYVVLDTGAQDAVGNDALRSLIDARRRASRGSRTVELLSVTGDTVTGETDWMTQLVLGGVAMRRVPVIYAPLHTFDVYRLADEPALMLGMSILRNFRRVSIDFGRRDIAFTLPREAGSVL